MGTCINALAPATATPSIMNSQCTSLLLIALVGFACSTPVSEMAPGWYHLSLKNEITDTPDATCWNAKHAEEQRCLEFEGDAKGEMTEALLDDQAVKIVDGHWDFHLAHDEDDHDHDNGHTDHDEHSEDADEHPHVEIAFVGGYIDFHGYDEDNCVGKANVIENGVKKIFCAVFHEGHHESHDH